MSYDLAVAVPALAVEVEGVGFGPLLVAAVDGGSDGAAVAVAVAVAAIDLGASDCGGGETEFIIDCTSSSGAFVKRVAG